MSDAIFMLRLEHGNIADVLNLLEDQIQRIQSGAPTDPGLLRLTLDYLRDFPEECHHPKEDFLFRMLQQRYPERAAALVDLCAAHEELAEFTARISEAVAGDGRQPDLAALLREYVDAYRHHMSGEEREFFPAALDTFTRDDLATLDYEIFDRVDRLFDDATEARFVELRRTIQARADESPPAAKHAKVRSSTNELTLFRQLDSVKAFNEAMHEHGIRLVAYRAGGYALERIGRWLADIPDCDEHRAAWCAYFYWKAIGDGGSE